MASRLRWAVPTQALCIIQVEALLSRLRHYCHTVTIDGPSLRDLQG